MSEELKQRFADCKRSAQIHGPAMEWGEFLSAHPWAWPMWNDAYRSNTARRATPAMPSPSSASAETFANLLRIQRAEAETGDPYMVGLYNGMAMMCANIDGDLNWKPMECRPAAPVAPSGAQEVAAWAVISKKGGIHKLAITRESAERKTARWQEEWPNNGCSVRPLVFGDVAPVPAIAPVQDERELIEAAEAVVARWYTPKWKDEKHTAEFIERLRRAIPVAQEGAATTQQEPKQ